MLESLLSLSPGALFAISVLVPNLVAVPIVLAVLNRKVSSSEGDGAVLGPTVGFIGTSFSLLLTLLMVSIWSDQTASQQVLFEEMTTIQSILIQARSIAPDRSVALKASALKYVDLIRERELDAAPPMGGDPAAQRAFEDTLRMIQDFGHAVAADPQRAAQVQGLFEESRQWTENREDRVNKPSGQLDSIMISVLAVLALFTVVLFALLPAATSPWSKWTQTLGTATTVGLGMFLVFYISCESFAQDAEDQQITRIQEAVVSSDDRPVARETQTPPTTAAPR